MDEVALEVLISIITFIIGLMLACITGLAVFLIKQMWDKFVGRRDQLREELRQNSIKKHDEALSKFYWPIYIRLCNNLMVWINLKNNKHYSSELIDEIKYKTILPTHLEIVAILENNLHLATPDSEFLLLILAYIKHVSIFKSLSDDKIKNISKDPKDSGSPFPKNFIKRFEEETIRIQNEYNALLGYSEIDNNLFIDNFIKIKSKSQMMEKTRGGNARVGHIDTTREDIENNLNLSQQNILVSDRHRRGAHNKNMSIFELV